MYTFLSIPEIKEKKRVVIVGGGFAGLKLARSLDSRHFQIVLIDINNYHQFQPLFYQVATSGLEPSAIVFPFRKIFQRRQDHHFRLCRALRVIPEKNLLETSIGHLHYDHLVLATGCDTNFFGKEYLRTSTFTLKAVAEALNIRNSIIGSFEKALITEDEAERRSLMNFVIVGGGATGVELAGALAEMRKFVLPKDYPELDFDAMKISIVDSLPRLLGVMSEKASAHAMRYMKKLGVEVLLNTMAEDYTNNEVKLSNGDTIVSCNVFWVAGVTANGLAGLRADTRGRAGRIPVNRFSQVCGYENIFAIGDTACMPDEEYPEGHPQVAPVAIQQAAYLASNLRKLVRGCTMAPFHYRKQGTLATVGRNLAVADLPFVFLSGFTAWALWLFIHLMSIVGVKNRLFIFLNWMWSYFTYDQSLRVIIKPAVQKKDQNGEVVY